MCVCVNQLLLFSLEYCSPRGRLHAIQGKTRHIASSRSMIILDSRKAFDTVSLQHTRRGSTLARKGLRLDQGVKPFPAEQAPFLAITILLSHHPILLISHCKLLHATE